MASSFQPARLSAPQRRKGLIEIKMAEIAAAQTAEVPADDNRAYATIPCGTVTICLAGAWPLSTPVQAAPFDADRSLPGRRTLVVDFPEPWGTGIV